MVIPSKGGEIVMHLEKIQNEAPKLPALVMQSLIRAMQDGYIQVGKPLPSERVLAESLGVGRGSLRECLAILDFLGAIETTGNRKTVVRDAYYIQRAIVFMELCCRLDSQDALMDFRLVNESHIAERACERATEDDLAALRDALRLLDERPWDISGEIAFHEALATASHNEVLAATLNLFISTITDFRSRLYSLPDYVVQAQESHQAIYDAVAARDTRRARYEIYRHLNIAQNFLKEHPEL